VKCTCETHLWVVVKWNGMGWYIIKFHCLDWWDVNGMEWNTMEPIPFYTTQSFNFSFPPIWEVSNGMKLVSRNFTILPSFYLPLPLLNNNWQHVFSISTDCSLLCSADCSSSSPVFSILYDFSSQGTSFLPHLIFHSMLLCMFCYVYHILFVTVIFSFL